MIPRFKSKKKTIFRMFIIPLITVIFAQAVVSFGTLWLGGTAGYLAEYSVSIMEQIVRNRNLILENSMIHRWSDISNECQTVNTHLGQMLTKYGISEAEFLQNKEMKKELLNNMLTPTISMLRRNGVNGAYVILADGFQEGTEAETEDYAAGGVKCSGFYFRDSDALINPQDFSDLLMVRGDFEFSHELGIPFDTTWTTKFQFDQESTRKDDNFFYMPYRGAMNNTGAKAKDLGYWSKVFTLEGAVDRDSYQMISYSMPLISENGYVYGVLGIEISLPALEALLPENELNSGKQSGYMLAEYDKDGNLVPFMAKGAAVKRNISMGEPLSLQTTDYRDLYRIDNTDRGENVFYGDIQPFTLYNSHTPFSSTGWALIGAQDEEGLFGIGSRIMRNVLSVICASLLLGFLCIYILMNHLTRPISALAEWIRNTRSSGLKEFKKTDIVEIDDLYEAVYDLTERQKKAEYAALEEKERYLAALKSSTDIIFTYNAVDDSIEILNLEADSESRGRENRQRQVLQSITSNKDVHEADRPMLERVFKRLDDSFKVHYRFRTEADGWQWMELSGKTMPDDAGNRVKIIGSIRNIHEQKTRELMENRATRMDTVTGLYREKIGQRIISAEVEMGRDGYLVLMDLDNFKELNEQYGIDFGDGILEEVGSFLSKLKRDTEKNGKRVVAVRAGGDEILVWLRKFKEDEMKEFFQRFYKMLHKLYQADKFEVTITAVSLRLIKNKLLYKDLTEHLCTAMSYCKKRKKGELVFYSELPEEELRFIRGESRGFNEVASLGNSRDLNTVTKAFNLFERGNQVAPVISLLFAKIGDAYRIRDIVMVDIRWDFNTSNVYRQWHAAEDAENDNTIRKFPEEVLAACEEKLSVGEVHFEENNEFTDGERKLLHIPLGFPGICFPLYDNRKLMGAVSFIQRPEHKRFTESEAGELREITRIIETNVNRERYDLASRAKSDFLSRMSHEIRTPMNAIIGMTEIVLKKYAIPEEARNCLGKIGQSSHYLLSLINDILDMSKIESGKMKLALGEGSLASLGEEVSDLMSAQIEEKQILYKQDVHLKHPWIIGDMMRLKQVVINLMSNAVKFTGQGGKITLTIIEKGWDQAEVSQGETSDTEVYFAVSDTGIGIGKEHQERIFDAFEQAENATAKFYGGTGLGLSISSRLVRMMGGDIGLESEEGQGSCFYFRLKFKIALKQEADNGRNLQIAEKNFYGCKVLLVEDNELNTEIAKTLLEMKGFSVDTAENGLAGVKTFEASESNYYDVILMDIRMPVMDGLEATKEIRRLNRPDARSVPIIAMTANAFDEDTKKSIDSGMNGHLAKPVDVDELLKAVDRLIPLKPDI